MNKIVWKYNMSCVCGYEYEEIRYEHESDNTHTKGDEDFLRLKVEFESDIIDNRKDIFVCPKCGTIKFNL